MVAVFRRDIASYVHCLWRLVRVVQDEDRKEGIKDKEKRMKGEWFSTATDS